MKLPHRRRFLHLAAGAAALPAVSRFAWAQALFLAMMLAASSLAAAETPLTIDQLLAQGWEIAGYASGYDNRTSLILFRHPGVNVLVQCGILYDVTRAQRTVVNCYELRRRGRSPRRRPTSIPRTCGWNGHDAA